MTTTPTAGDLPVARPRIYVRRARRDRRPLALVCGGIAVAAAALVVLDPSFRPILLPLLAILLLDVVYVAEMIRRDRRVPVMEAASMLVLVITVYGAVPLINYAAGGLQWGAGSDNRLVQYRSTPAEVGSFAWGHVALLAAFVGIYLWARGRPAPLALTLRRPDKTTIIAVVAFGVALVVYFWFVGRLFGLTYEQSYAAGAAGAPVPLTADAPFIVKQLSHNLRLMLTLDKQLLLILLIGGWKSVWSRVLVFALLGFDLAMLLTRYYGRTEMVILLLTCAVLYARLVRPLTLKAIAVGISAALVAIMVYGLAREAVIARVAVPASVPLASSNNEFQALWGTAFDLHQRRAAGLLRPIPWQLYLSDLYYMIPSQFLPFEKIDPALWYLDAIGDHSGTGYMFGIMSQAAVGWGKVELALRGALLALVLAALHRWYARHQSGFWPTAFYMFVITWIYYAVRATTFYWLYFVVYAFLPAMLFTMFLALLMKVPVRLRRGENG